MNATIVYVTIIPIFIITVTTLQQSSCVWVRGTNIRSISDSFFFFFFKADSHSCIIFFFFIRTTNKNLNVWLLLSVVHFLSLHVSLRLTLQQRDADTANHRTIGHSWCPAMQWWSCSALHPHPPTPQPAPASTAAQECGPTSYPLPLPSPLLPPPPSLPPPPPHQRCRHRNRSPSHPNKRDEEGKKL